MTKQQGAVITALLAMLFATTRLATGGRHSTLVLVLHTLIVFAVFFVRQAAGVGPVVYRFQPATWQRMVLLVVLASAALFVGWHIVNAYALSLAQATDFESR